MGTVFLLLFLLLVFSASFSSLETALFSLSPVERFRLKAAGGVSLLITRVLEKPRDLLTTVLFGNEMVNVAISILAGTVAYDLITGADIRSLYLGSIGVTTLVLLIAGEIVPKNIAVRFPVVVSQVLIVPYQLFAWLVFPLRVVLTRIADGIVSLFGADPAKGRRLIVEEELRDLIELGKNEGTLADLERTLLQNALDFSRLTASEVMTPRQKIVAIPIHLSLPEILDLLKENRFSRLPVYDQNLNQIVGVLHAKELLACRLSSKGSEAPSLREMLKPCAAVSGDETLDRLFEEYQRHKIHMGIVKDRGGNTTGLITMDDLLRRFFPS